MEIFTLVTGIVYIVLEIRQKNLMWVVGMVTSAAAMYVFFSEGLYASFGLNTYYFAVAFWGLYQWRRDSGRLSSEVSVAIQKEDVIHLNRLSLKTVLVSLAVFAAGTAVLIGFMEYLGDTMSYMDSAIAVLSAVATWWLCRSYLQQWLLWILADALLTIMCLRGGMYWMSALYLAYTAAAIYGYFHWRRNGVVLS